MSNTSLIEKLNSLLEKKPWWDSEENDKDFKRRSNGQESKEDKIAAEAKRYKDHPDTVTFYDGTKLVRNGDYWTDSRGQRYSFKDVAYLRAAQGYKTNSTDRTSQLAAMGSIRRDNYLRYEKQQSKKQAEQDPVGNYKQFFTAKYNDDFTYIDLGGRKRVKVWLNPPFNMIKNIKPVAYAVTDQGKILLSNDLDLISDDCLRMLRKYNRIGEYSIGILQYKGGIPEMLPTPKGGPLIIYRNGYEKQLDLMNFSMGLLAKNYKFRTSKNWDYFIKYVVNYYKNHGTNSSISYQDFLDHKFDMRFGNTTLNQQAAQDQQDYIASKRFIKTKDAVINTSTYNTKGNNPLSGSEQEIAAKLKQKYQFGGLEPDQLAQTLNILKKRGLVQNVTQVFKQVTEG